MIFSTYIVHVICNHRTAVMDSFPLWLHFSFFRESDLCIIGQIQILYKWYILRFLKLFLKMQETTDKKCSNQDWRPSLPDIHNIQSEGPPLSWASQYNDAVSPARSETKLCTRPQSHLVNLAQFITMEIQQTFNFGLTMSATPHWVIELLAVVPSSSSGWKM